MQKETKKRRGYATQAQQREADKRYYHASEENRQRKQYLNTRSTARNFIEKRAKFEDLKDLQERIEKKLKYFKEEVGHDEKEQAKTCHVTNRRADHIGHAPGSRAPGRRSHF